MRCRATLDSTSHGGPAMALYGMQKGPPAGFLWERGTTFKAYRLSCSGSGAIRIHERYGTPITDMSRYFSKPARPMTASPLRKRTRACTSFNPVAGVLRGTEIHGSM